MDKKEGVSQPNFEENYYSLAIDHVYIGSRTSSDNLMSLVSMVEKKNLPLLLPGITVVSTKEEDALRIFNQEHKSRNALVNVLFRIDLSIQCKGTTSETWGNQQQCFDLNKILDDD